ncbi:MAG TPA: ABC transporter permease [Ktedonobacteraceae bacterium]|jgi:osmoprotectant transport system permease protein|nr:ABC transporter permease [Ktedonobacteraceae bacterium]
MDILQFITDPHHHFIGVTLEFLQICGISIALAIMIGIVLGIAVSRSAIAGFIAINLTGLLRAIPVMVFLIAALPLLGTGDPPALVALIVLGTCPILVNTYTGIRGIDPSIIDAARGMGMTIWQILTRIQIPLVLPVLAAGIRTAAVQIIATATLASYIGAGGYGVYIVNGVKTFDNTQILAGAIPVALLAMIIEVLMSWLQQLLTPTKLGVQTIPEAAKA